MNNAIEAVGYGLIVAFLYLLWAPLALLGGGLLLVVWANVREAQGRQSAGGRTAAALGAAAAAFRRAYRQPTTEGPAELRRVS